MKISPTAAKVAEISADAVVLGVDAEAVLTKEAREIDEACGGLLTKLLEQDEVSGKLGEVSLLYGLSQVCSPMVAVVGLAALSLAGCSVKTFAVNRLGDALSAPGPSVYTTDDDPDLIKAALPFSLKTLESLLHLPVQDREMFYAKLLTAFIPAMAVSWNFIVVPPR